MVRLIMRVKFAYDAMRHCYSYFPRVRNEASIIIRIKLLLALFLAAYRASHLPIIEEVRTSYIVISKELRNTIIEMIITEAVTRVITSDVTSSKRSYITS